MPLYRMDVMGTDPDDAMQFRTREVHTGTLAAEFGGQELVGVDAALTTAVTSIINRWFEEHSVPDSCRAIVSGYRENLFRAPRGYPARPLDGYWATGPFLHNGSVPNMYELLSPERSERFWLGSRDFDPEHLGPMTAQTAGSFLYDTSLPGNSSAGHEFRHAPPNTPDVIGGALSHEERLDLIEYLKVIDEIEINEVHLLERRAMLESMAPYYEDYSGAADYGTPQHEGGWSMRELCSAVETALAEFRSAPEDEDEGQ